MNFDLTQSYRSVNGQEIDIYTNMPQQQEKYLYLMAGVHGDEPEGVFVLQQLTMWLQQQEFMLPIVLIPKLNVDGLQLQRRTNANGVDLNRNLPTKNWQSEYSKDRYNPGPEPLSEPENVLLLDLFSRYKPSQIITFHSWKPLLNYNGNCQELANIISKHNKYEVVDDIGYPTPGSLGTYAQEVLECPVLTFECPTIDTRQSMQAIWEENRTGLQAMFNYFL